jgi:hypothetical protein
LISKKNIQCIDSVPNSKASICDGATRPVLSATAVSDGYAAHGRVRSVLVVSHLHEDMGKQMEKKL